VEKKMAIGVIAKITILEGKNQEFEREFLKLTEQVTAKESGNAFYILHRHPTDPQVYTVMEQYKTAEDLDAHSKTDHFREANKVLATLVAAAPEIEILETV
jgi:quinol monooxygenase YgiN